MEDTKKVVAQVPIELHKAAKVKAAQTGKPISEVIREALDKWVKDPLPEKQN